MLKSTRTDVWEECVGEVFGSSSIEQHNKASVREAICGLSKESRTSKVRNSRKFRPMDLKLGASLATAEHIPWLRWMFPIRRRGICQARCWQRRAEQHTRSRKQTGGAKQHFVDALQLQGKYDLSEDTIIGLLWAVARDPAVWKDPLEFRPERFLEEDVNMKGHDFRKLPFGTGRRVCPGAQVGINLVASMLGHLLHHFSWTPPDGVKPEEIDMSESPSLVTYMKSPLQAVATPGLPSSLYKCIAADVSYYVLQRIHIPTLSMGKKMSYYHEHILSGNYYLQ